jgi:hypothetical protein
MSQIENIDSLALVATSEKPSKQALILASGVLFDSIGIYSIPILLYVLTVFSSPLCPDLCTHPPPHSLFPINTVNLVWFGVNFYPHTG